MAQEPGALEVAAQEHSLHYSSCLQPSPQHPSSTQHAQASNAPHLRQAPEEAEDEEAQVQEADEAHEELETQTRQELKLVARILVLIFSVCSPPLAYLNLFVAFLMLLPSLAELWLV